jgi:TPR repeat protein
MLTIVVVMTPATIIAMLQVVVAYKFTFGAGVEKNVSEAERYLLLAAEHGNSNALHAVAVGIQNREGRARQSYQDAKEYYEKASMAGNVKSHYELATILSTGAGGVTKDEVEAFRLFELAAEQGHALSQLALGKCYDQGEFERAWKGVPRDSAKALHWLTKAAEQGNVDAMRDTSATLLHVAHATYGGYDIVGKR